MQGRTREIIQITMRIMHKFTAGKVATKCFPNSPLTVLYIFFLEGSLTLKLLSQSVLEKWPLKIKYGKESDYNQSAFTLRKIILTSSHRKYGHPLWMPTAPLMFVEFWPIVAKKGSYGWLGERATICSPKFSGWA